MELGNVRKEERLLGPNKERSEVVSQQCAFLGGEEMKHARVKRLSSSEGVLLYFKLFLLPGSLNLKTWVTQHEKLTILQFF